MLMSFRILRAHRWMTTAAAVRRSSSFSFQSMLQRAHVTARKCNHQEMQRGDNKARSTIVRSICTTVTEEGREHTSAGNLGIA